MGRVVGKREVMGSFLFVRDSGAEWRRSSALETERPHLNRGCWQV